MANEHREEDSMIPASSAAEVDVDPGHDADSALGDEAASDTTSLASSILRHRQEWGRTYHKFRAGENDYWGPNDEQQNDGLDIGHHMLTLLLSNRLYLAPIDEQNCRHVLDLGCGTGIWAIDFADSHPDTEVIGVDISPIQPTWVPPNVSFVIDDIEEEFQYPRDHFDFINIRCLYGSISDWPALYKQIYDHLKPGAWFQHLEFDITFLSDDGTVGEDNALTKWSRTFIGTQEITGKSFDIARDSQRLFMDTGFEDVHCQWFKLPVGKWPKDKALKHIGMWNYHYCMEGCEGWALFLLGKILKWSLEEIQVFVAEFRNAIQNGKNHAYYPVAVVWGRKPEHAKTGSI